MRLSRNTISRALNDEPGVSKEMKEKILQTAFEKGYKAGIPKQFINQNKNIALVSFYNALNDSFWHPFVVGLERVVRREGYSLLMCHFNEEDSKKRMIPSTVQSEKVAGIVMIGLYSQRYAQCFVDLGLPIVFVDCNVEINIGNLVADVIKMDNERSTYELTKYLIREKGCTRLGFYGDVAACAGYQERYQGFLKALTEFNLPFNPEESLVFDTKERYTSESTMRRALQKINYLPEAFVCCNDGRAISLMAELKKMDYRVPEDIKVVGFDDQREASMVTPALTTIKCDREHLGYRTGEELFWRFKNPDRPFEIITLPTQPVIRESSE